VSYHGRPAGTEGSMASSSGNEGLRTKGGSMTEQELRAKLRQIEHDRDQLLKQKKPIDLELYHARRLYRLYSEQLHKMQQDKAA
jgi:hypothetical protein